MNLYSSPFFLPSRIISSSELQFFASRHAAAIAAVAAAALPPPPSSATNPNGVGLSSSASGLNAPPPIPPTHQHDFHPAYRIPGYMEHLYSLQHASAASSSSLHGKHAIHYTLHSRTHETNAHKPFAAISRPTVNANTRDTFSCDFLDEKRRKKSQNQTKGESVKLNVRFPPPIYLNPRSLKQNIYDKMSKRVGVSANDWKYKQCSLYIELLGAKGPCYFLHSIISRSRRKFGSNNQLLSLLSSNKKGSLKMLIKLTS